jgi:hypothetical protein
MKKFEIDSAVRQFFILRATPTLILVILVLELFSQAATIRYIKLNRPNANYPFIHFKAPPRVNESGDKMIVNIEGESDIFKKRSDGEWVFFEKLPFDAENLIHFGNDLIVTDIFFKGLYYSKRENGFWKLLA